MKKTLRSNCTPNLPYADKKLSSLQTDQSGVIEPNVLLSEIRPKITKLLVLDLLAVDPEHQGKGAGTKLISWGLEQADQMGAEVSEALNKLFVSVELRSGNSRLWSRVR